LMKLGPKKWQTLNSLNLSTQAQDLEFIESLNALLYLLFNSVFFRTSFFINAIQIFFYTFLHNNIKCICLC
jgi:hypothetical protein